MYGTTSKQYREFGEWLAGLVAVLTTAAQKREEHATAKLKEVDDEIQRLTEENRTIREDTQRRIEEIQAQGIAEIEAQKQQRIAAIHEAAQREMERITTLREAVLGVIAGERGRIHQVAAAAMAKSDDVSVSQVLREIEESWLGVEHLVGELVH